MKAEHNYVYTLQLYKVKLRYKVILFMGLHIKQIDQLPGLSVLLHVRSS